jgi:hypothetical protein
MKDQDRRLFKLEEKDNSRRLTVEDIVGEERCRQILEEARRYGQEGWKGEWRYGKDQPRN